MGRRGGCHGLLGGHGQDPVESWTCRAATSPVAARSPRGKQAGMNDSQDDLVQRLRGTDRMSVRRHRCGPSVSGAMRCGGVDAPPPWPRQPRSSSGQPRSHPAECSGPNQTLLASGSRPRRRPARPPLPRRHRRTPRWNPVSGMPARTRRSRAPTRCWSSSAASGMAVSSRWPGSAPSRPEGRSATGCARRCLRTWRDRDGRSAKPATSRCSAKTRRDPQRRRRRRERPCGHRPGPRGGGLRIDHLDAGPPDRRAVVRDRLPVR